MPSLDDYLRKLEAKHESELLLCADHVPLCQTARGLIPLAASDAPIAAAELDALLFDLLGADARSKLQAYGFLRFSAAHGQSRVGGTCIEGRRGISVTLRVLPSTPLDCAALQLPPSAIAASEHAAGLVIVTGRMRSGKSATLAALLEHARETRGAHATTIQAAIELRHPKGRGLVSHRQVGVHCESFADGIASAVRTDSDLILVSELDAPGAFAAALAAAEAGALVLGGVRASGAARAHALLLSGVASDQLAGVTATFRRVHRATLAQTLVQRPGGGVDFSCDVTTTTGV